MTRLGEGDVRIPTLRQVIDTVPPAVDLMVDFTRREVVAGALDQALAADALDRCLFVTGNVAALAAVAWAVRPGPHRADLDGG